MTHICVSYLNITGSNNGLSPDWRQAIIWINDRKLLIGPISTSFCGLLVEINIFSFKKTHLNIICLMSAILSRPQYVNSPSCWASLTCLLSHSYLLALMYFHWSFRISLTSFYALTHLFLTHGNNHLMSGSYNPSCLITLSSPFT